MVTINPCTYYFFGKKMAIKWGPTTFVATTGITYQRGFIWLNQN
jgi:hypothetical protein